LITYILIFLVSITILLIASDKFVDSAEKIGLSLGIPSFIIGVTIVAFGTSLPELATSIAAVYSGSSEIVIGNVVGSNITNILLVLGAAAIFGKGIRIDYDVMNVDMPMLIASSFFLYFIIVDFHVSTIECVLLFAALVIFLSNSFTTKSDEEDLNITSKPLDYVILIIAGVLVYFSADYTIYGMKNIAILANIPTHVIAITAVALGTSLPEVIVSINAAKKGKHGIAVGNVLGSNLFNTYAVISIPGLLGDLKIPSETMQFSIPFMIIMTILFAIMTISKRISMWEGFLLLLFYVFFISNLLDNQL